MSAVNYSVSYSERHPKYKNFTEEEWNIKISFSYDDNFGFSDLRIFRMQNDHRNYYMWDVFGVPPESASFCTAFNTNRERTRLIQRHLCNNLCFWDPQECFLKDSHSGNLSDLMHKGFHEQFNPAFSEQFSRIFRDKIDWAPTGGLGNYPSIGLKKLIEEIGITTNLSYDADHYAVNFENLSKEFRNSIPDRPFYVMEEKKCHDVIEALININREKIENSRKEMELKYDESYRGNGPIRQPVLSLMMWGPLTYFDIKKTDSECKYDTLIDRQAGAHVCSNFAEKHFWMYTHSERVECIRGSIDNLAGPVMTPDLKIIYPCNRSGCNHICVCDLCTNSHMCPTSDHKKHMQELQSECSIEQNFQCQEHKVGHPQNFSDKEDILVEKNLFYHNLKLEKKPRKFSTGSIKFAGIKKMCKLCSANVKNHFKHHKVPHLNCKFCVFQMRTMNDKTFWDKVCNLCGKICSNVNSLKYWHKRTHSSDWMCHDCDMDFNRKWNLKRHLIEIHDRKARDFDFESQEVDDDFDSMGNEPEDINDESDSSDIDNKSENDSSNSDALNESGREEKSTGTGLKCNYCEKEFSVQRYLDTHIKDQHTARKTFICDQCDHSFTLNFFLKRHEETIHGKKKTGVLEPMGAPKSNTCNFCGMNFYRTDNLNEHIKRAHLKENKKFTCQNCGQKFDKKFNMNRHEKTCNVDLLNK